MTTKRAVDKGERTTAVGTPLYPWGEWLAPGAGVVIAEGRDFDVPADGFHQTVRNEAHRRGLLVSVRSEGGGSLRVRVKGPSPRGFVVVGVDPGKSGGGAAVWADGKTVLDATAMPRDRTGAGVQTWLRHVKEQAGDRPVRGWIEVVGGYTSRDGPQPGSTMFTFGRGDGLIRSALTAVLGEGQWQEVGPATWQSGLGVPPRVVKGKEIVETKAAWKGRLAATARERFPGEHVTLATADALLIAAWGAGRAAQEITGV